MLAVPASSLCDFHLETLRAVCIGPGFMATFSVYLESEVLNVLGVTCSWRQFSVSLLTRLSLSEVSQPFL